MNLERPRLLIDAGIPVASVFCIFSLSRPLSLRSGSAVKTIVPCYTDPFDLPMV